MHQVKKKIKKNNLIFIERCDRIIKTNKQTKKLQHVIRYLNESSNPVESLKQAFSLTHEEIKTKNISGGTTALISLFLGDKCYIANLGDSRAVLWHSNGDITKRISTDHKPHLPEEEQRVTSQGGFVTKQSNRNGQIISRVNGLLAVSRALGDTFLDKYVSHDPEVHVVELKENEHSVLILACDGLWDVVSDEEATKLISDMDNPEQAAITLRNTALSKGSTDNISVVVIFIPPLSKPSPPGGVNQNQDNSHKKKETKASTAATPASPKSVKHPTEENSQQSTESQSSSGPTHQHQTQSDESEPIPSPTDKQQPHSQPSQPSPPQQQQQQQQQSQPKPNQQNQNASSHHRQSHSSSLSENAIWKSVVPVIVGASAVVIGLASYVLVAKK